MSEGSHPEETRVEHIESASPAKSGHLAEMPGQAAWDQKAPSRAASRSSLDQRMQSLDCGLAALHRNKQIYRMRGQNTFVDDNSLLLQNLNRLKWQS
jgi:hypothetical protein